MNAGGRWHSQVLWKSKCFWANKLDYSTAKGQLTNRLFLQENFCLTIKKLLEVWDPLTNWIPHSIYLSIFDLKRINLLKMVGLSRTQKIRPSKQYFHFGERVIFPQLEVCRCRKCWCKHIRATSREMHRQDERTEWIILHGEVGENYGNTNEPLDSFNGPQVGAAAAAVSH